MSARLEITQLSGDLLRFRAGGLARYVDGLVRGLSPLANVQLIGVGDASDPDAAASADMRRWGRLRAIRSRVAAHLPKTDLIASHFALYTSSSLDLIRQRPHVLHFHGPWAAESAAEGAGHFSVAAKRFVEKRVYATATRAITLSRAFATILIEDYGVPEDRVRIIPGGIDVPTEPLIERRTAREQLGYPIDRPIILCVRRLARRMGLDVLIDAAIILRRTQPEMLMLIAGKGALHAELQSRINHADLNNHVKLLGFVPDAQLPIAFAAADVSVVPSQTLEGFGLVTLESLVQGTPVLVTPVGGLPEVVTHVDRSLILENTDARSIADGLATALKLPAQLPTRDRCRDYAIDTFGWPTIANRVLDVYREAVHAAS